MESNANTILEGLNSEQKRAVSCVDGPVLIVAGAGSGKTRVLTGRIAYLLEKGCPPDRILALTFTKKAASEMKERIAMMVGERKARRLFMGTFHSVFIRFLREFAESLGYPSGFTIYDTGDSISAIKSCIKELQLRMSFPGFRWPRTTLSHRKPTAGMLWRSRMMRLPGNRGSATYISCMPGNAASRE